jgi:hypothetical protein
MLKLSQKVITVPLPAELVNSMNLLSQERAEPLAVLIKEACAEFLASARDAEMDREYIESSGRFSDGSGETTPAVVSESWPLEDDWS